VGLLRLIRSRELDTAVTALSKRLPRG
jgi:hypothetical protein